MRKSIITKEWLADFYAQGVKPKYRGSLKPQASSSKQQAIDETVPHQEILESQAPSGKLQAPSSKRQASSRKRQAP